MINITRPKQQNTERLYLHFSTEKSANFLFRRTITITNKSTNPSTSKIKVTPFIPPQLYTRFTDLSRHAYRVRQENTDMKTQIKIGEEDLVLLMKKKGDKEWIQKDDI